MEGRRGRRCRRGRQSAGLIETALEIKGMLSFVEAQS